MIVYKDLPSGIGYTQEEGGKIQNTWQIAPSFKSKILKCELEQ